jgi:hypothetical protein
MRCQVYDLLDLTNETLAVKWDAKTRAFFVSDLLSVVCESYDDIMTVVTEGYKNRRIGSTALNKDSSRSHRCGRRGDATKPRSSAPRGWGT